VIITLLGRSGKVVAAVLHNKGEKLALEVDDETDHL
jgi:hypothetical protein